MIDINNMHDIEVSESIQDLAQSTRSVKLLIVTDSVPPAFAMLKCVTMDMQDPHLLGSVIYMDNDAYLGSQQFMSLSPSIESYRDTRRIQGPSIEIWNEYEDTSESGRDHVQSILCKSWPTSAAEWKDRPRNYGWPSQQDREYIKQFGCHLVPVGHPLSARKSLEWRLSFSIAERTLVWSFNHTQLQCYAVMKLILKEFIKKKCSERHKSVLCSYFIKTFLFWQFERTESSFWEPRRLTTCIMYLLNTFCNCIRTGVLRHYFVPRFNLLEIKLTPEAQSEFLPLFEMVREIGVSILNKCDSLAEVFFKFYQVTSINQCIRRKEEIRRFRALENDSVFMAIFTVNLLYIIHKPSDTFAYEKMLVAVVRLNNEGNCSTLLPLFTIRYVCRLIATARLYSCFNQGHKRVCYYMATLTNNIHGTDIASSKLWLATFWYWRGDCYRALKIINDIFSAIPPYALYYTCKGIHTGDDSKQLYIDIYSVRNSNIICRANKSWLADMHITHREYSFMPHAIKIELEHCDPAISVRISPFTYAYYLMFLCYHGLGQYDNRDRALHQLAETVQGEERCSLYKFYSLNIAGHCMLMAGYVEMGRYMFLRSARLTHKQKCKAWDKYNAAYAYLSYM